jgi:hypothetical protein
LRGDDFSPGQETPNGQEVRVYLRHLVRCIRLHWPQTCITIRGDSHYGRPEVMAWCEANAVRDLFGLSGNAVLARKVEAAADAVRVRHALGDLDGVRDYAETRYAAGSWTQERRGVARIEEAMIG